MNPDRSPSPQTRWLAQAERCRREWRRLSAVRRTRLIARLRRENHPIGRIWIDVLDRQHPLVAWLDSDAPASDLLALDTSPDARQLITSHPFSDWTAWSTLPTSPESSSTVSAYGRLPFGRTCSPRQARRSGSSGSRQTALPTARRNVRYSSQARLSRTLLDAGRVVKSGEVVVFGSGALAFFREADAPTTPAVDIWVEPEARGEIVEAVMGELSWYHDKHDAYVEVWRPETFAAPATWRERARVLTDETVSEVRLVVPHPHDVLLSKLERWSASDQEHAARILPKFPMSPARRDALVSEMPHRTGSIDAPERRAAFEANVRSWLAGLASG